MLVVVIVVVGGKMSVRKVGIRVGARGPLGVGGARGALRPVGRGMLALRCAHKAGRRDGRGDAMVVVMVVVVLIKWYRYRYRYR